MSQASNTSSNSPTNSPTSSLQAIRGMADILPADTPLWQTVERVFQQLVTGYGFREIRFPIVEPTELFKRSIGEVTDIVEKEMYCFQDRNGDSISMRPEGTAGCVRAANQHGLLHNQQQRLWYCGPMFRYERPQKGRQRQFHQFGVECFGMAGPDIDAELLLMTARFWQQLGLTDTVELQLNSIGSVACRARYKQALVEYLSSHKAQLDEDSLRRLDTNPLRILDSKNPAMQPLLADAPKLPDFLGDESRAHFEQLQAYLSSAGLTYRINSRLVRGLDYYNNTVFEWVTTRLGAQGAVCAGGRYDGLVAQLGGAACPAVGFAMGIERLCLLLQEVGSIDGQFEPVMDAYFIAAGEGVYQQALALSEQLRDAIPGLSLQLNAGGGSFKSQMKRADRSGARWAVIMGEQEAATHQVVFKDLRQAGSEQRTLNLAELIAQLSAQH